MLLQNLRTWTVTGRPTILSIILENDFQGVGTDRNSRGNSLSTYPVPSDTQDCINTYINTSILSPNTATPKLTIISIWAAEAPTHDITPTESTFEIRPPNSLHIQDTGPHASNWKWQNRQNDKQKCRQNLPINIITYNLVNLTITDSSENWEVTTIM